MTEISMISFDVETLNALEGLFEHRVHFFFREIHGLSFNLAVCAKGDTAPLTFGNTQVGVVVGKFKNSTAA